MARHGRRNGRSEYKIAQSARGILYNADDSFVGSMTTNLVGSKYHIWDQVHFLAHSNGVLNCVEFDEFCIVPMIVTWFLFMSVLRGAV